MSNPPPPEQANAPKIAAPHSKGSGSYQVHSSTITGADIQDDYTSPYLEHDIETEQELSFDDFIQHILNCPNLSSNPPKRKQTEQMVTDATFTALLNHYPTKGTSETDYYHPFVELANHVLKKKKKKHCIAFCRNVSGSAGKRKPDVITALREAIFDLKTRVSDDNCRDTEGPDESPFHWVDLLGFAEFKQYGSDAALQSGRATATTSSSSTSSHSDSSNKRAEKVSVKIQCASYALEMLLNGGLRTHVIGFLVAKDKLQLLHFDRSIFIISTSLDFRADPPKFVALLLLLDELSDEQWGFVPPFSPLFKVPSTDLFLGKPLSLHGPLKLGLKEIMSRYHGFIGRGACVVRASIKNPPKDRKSVVAMKISSPASTRASENGLIQLALSKATSSSFTHLPRILHHEDLDNVTRRNLSAFYTAAGKEEDRYELRTLRVIVYDELLPITQLTKAADLAAALRDIFNCYKWLVQDVGILHRDISLSNFMYRKKEEKLFGVLNDFDLASKTGGDPFPSSKQRTGTKPYMAYELLKAETVIHRYRHDLESFFYVILILTSHFENGKEISNPPLEEWFFFDSETLSKSKFELMVLRQLPPPRQPYTGFTQWLKPMCAAFANGLFRSGLNQTNDSDTLGGNVTFEKMAKILEEKIE